MSNDTDDKLEQQPTPGVSIWEVLIILFVILLGVAIAWVAVQTVVKENIIKDYKAMVADQQTEIAELKLELESTREDVSDFNITLCKRLGWLENNRLSGYLSVSEEYRETEEGIGGN